MIKLFNEYKNKGKMTEALLIGRNMINKEPGNYGLVSQYMDLVLNLAERLPSLNERKSFMSQAEISLSFFEENADLSEEMIDRISNLRKKINEIEISILKAENEQANLNMAAIESENHEQIKELYNVKKQITEAKNQGEFDELLQKISVIDSKIKHDLLTDNQMVHYNELNRECTESISSKMRELEYQKNVAYNKRAVDAFNDAFKKFKNDEAKYKNKTQLFPLVSSTLFAFDAGRLFNETLIYYNHIYSFIFSKLDDDGKFALTRFSIECERKQR